VTPEPQAQIRSDIPGTTWHEAYPGHHLQFVYSKDNPSLVRRVNDSPLLSEGWGFYCEELASETGYYDDPRERLMQLDWKLQRAARVILDTQLHAFGLSYDDAVAFLVERVGMRPEQARASVNAYTQSPTYFSSYFLGCSRSCGCARSAARGWAGASRCPSSTRGCCAAATCRRRSSRPSWRTGAESGARQLPAPADSVSTGWTVPLGWVSRPMLITARSSTKSRRL
jgi:hypothetical protein